VYRFNDKYGANVDGYSPIWSPNEWSESGDTYKGGFAGLAIWYDSTHLQNEHSFVK
jgi:photosystem II protein